VPQDLSTHAKESVSQQKASEWAKSHVIVSYDKCRSLGDMGVIVKHAVCDYVVMSSAIPVSRLRRSAEHQRW
jgi:hypothetical protein